MLLLPKKSFTVCKKKNDFAILCSEILQKLKVLSSIVANQGENKGRFYEILQNNESCNIFCCIFVLFGIKYHTNHKSIKNGKIRIL